MTIHELPEPVVSFESAPFWEGCEQGKLLIQRCAACGKQQWFPRSRCRYCLAPEFEWIESSGNAVVHSFSIVTRPMNEAFADRVPYAIALVDLDEGIRMMTNIVGCEPGSVGIGMRVTVDFERRGDFALPVFWPSSIHRDRAGA